MINCSASVTPNSYLISLTVPIAMAASRAAFMMEIDPELLAMDSPGAGPSNYNHTATTAAAATRYDADDDDEVDELDFASAFPISQPIDPEDNADSFGSFDLARMGHAHPKSGLPRGRPGAAGRRRATADQTEDDGAGDDDIDQDEVFE